MSWIFLSVDAIRAAQHDLIEQYGGSHGLRDLGLLQSAVMRAENKAYFDPTATAVTLAASVSFGLIKNHAFLDGNKRIGLAALVDFLAFNGFMLTAPENEQIATVKLVASSKMTEEEWTEWVLDHSGPLED